MLCSLHTAKRTLRNRSINRSNKLMSSASTAHKVYASHLPKRSLTHHIFYAYLGTTLCISGFRSIYYITKFSCHTHEWHSLKESELLESNCKNFHLIHNFAFRMYNVTKLCKSLVDDQIHTCQGKATSKVGLDTSSVDQIVLFIGSQKPDSSPRALKSNSHL